MTGEQIQKIKAEEIWLNYFNRYLYEHQTISRKEYMRMTELISTHVGRKRKKLLSGG